MADYVYDGGGVLSYDVKKKSFESQQATNRSNGLLKYKQMPLSELPCDLQDDGQPLKNEYLEELRLKEEKQQIKERVILENYKEESYKNFVNDLLEASDDIFDSKGDDISKKEFLKNEMDLD